MESGFTFGSTTSGGTTGFSFGSTPAAGAATTAQPQANTSLNFGAAAAAAAQPQQQTIKPGQPTFGQQQEGNASFSFGTQQAPNMTTTSGTGFSFGQTPTAAPVAAPAPVNASFSGLSGTPQQAQQNPPPYNFGTAQPTQQQATVPPQQVAPAQAASGFTLGSTPGTTSSGGGFTLGGSTNQPNAGFQQLAKPTTTLSTGFNLTQTTKPTGIAFTTPVATQSKTLTLGGTPAKPAGATSLTFNSNTTSGGLTLGGTTAAPAGGGLTLGGTPALGGMTGSGLTLGAIKPVATTGAPTLGGNTAAVKPTLPLGATATTTNILGVLGGTATTATGIFATPSSTSTGLLAAAPAKVSTGLGGLDPKTMSSGTGASGTVGKPGDSKAVKETPILNEMQVTVDQFKKYVKNQKTVRENITRMSSTPLFKIQEEVANLKQLLSLVSNGLQRNSLTIDRLKQDSAQELKHAEIAQRTKETPPGLQYEHVAPADYFQRLVDGFESQMIFYRQQIEEMENHLNSLNMGLALTPQEMSQILAKLHETFIALAGQLQIVHEAVKIQKDHYLTYHRVLHGDNTDIFEKRRRAKQATGSSMVVSIGPTPFTNLSNPIAMAMASARNRTHPSPGMNTTGFAAGHVTGLGANPGTSGLLAGTTGTGFGMSIPQTGGFSTGFNLGSPANTATVRPLGSIAPGVFGSTNPQPSTGFSLNQSTTSTGGFGSSIPSSVPSNLGFGSTSTFATPGVNGQTSFLLQSPPLGTKRGKKA